MAKKKMTKQEAFDMAKRYGADFSKDAAQHGTSTMADLADIAKLFGYRKPKGASGSKGRYFFDYLKKAKQKGTVK